MSQSTKRIKALVLSEFLPFRLFALTYHFSQRLQKVYSDEFGLTRTEWRILAVLAQNPDISAREVADLGLLDKVAVSRAVAQLLQRGILARESDHRDKRRSVLSLTREGVALYEQVAPAVRKVEQAVLAGLSKSEREQIDSTIHELSRRLTSDLS